MTEINARLGQHASTVLTNRSGHITLVSDLPYIERQKTGFDASFSRYGRHIKGSRPMHQSTFTCGMNSKENTSYSSSTRDAYSGRLDLPHSKRPAKCQSLHHSQFNIGTSSELDCATQSMKFFNQKKIIPAQKLHEDRARWNNQMMASENMNKSLKHQRISNNYTSTSYNSVHNLLGKTLQSYEPKLRDNGKYNIISGIYIGPEEQRSFKLRSGNKILKNVRDSCKEPLLG